MDTGQQRKPIDSFALTQCTFNQPTAAIAAYEQFLRQSALENTADDKAHLIIIDSSPQPTAATAFYAHPTTGVMARDPRVTYLHVPVRPEYEAKQATMLQFAEQLYPAAYAWRRGGPYRDIYLASSPTNTQIKEAYINEPDVRQILHTNGAKAFAAIIETVAEPMSNLAATPQAVWRRAITEVFSRKDELYPKTERPHLSTKRLLAIEIAHRKGADMVAHLDDDWVGRKWVANHRQALESADVTGLKHYAVVIKTADMKKPVWGVTDLDASGQGFVVGFDGKPTPGAQLSPEPMQGWSLAHRINGALPENLQLPGFTPKLFGEDRLFLQRAEKAGLVIAPQTTYDPTLTVRGVFGFSSSSNNVNEIIDIGDSRLPERPIRQAVVKYYDTLRRDFVAR